jgi:hypothetical protein
LADLSSEQHLDKPRIINDILKNNKKQFNNKIQIEDNKANGIIGKSQSGLIKKSQKFFNIEKEDSMNINRSKENSVQDTSLHLNETERDRSVISLKSTKIFSIEHMATKKGNKLIGYNKRAKNMAILEVNAEDLLDSYKEIRDIKMLGRKRLHIPINPEVGGIENVKLNKVEFKPIHIAYIKNTFKQSLHNPDLAFELPYEKVRKAKIYEDHKPIPNQYDTYFRLEEANKLNFIRNFQEDYAPIKMQKDNEKIFENIAIGDAFTKTHFIKKKQSAVNIKRQSGVSYVVATESKQLNVESNYKLLGHLVYQGTHSIQQIGDDNIITHINNIISKQLMNGPLLVSVFESQDEDEMKQYLLNPNDRFKLTKE